MAETSNVVEIIDPDLRIKKEKILTYNIFLNLRKYYVSICFLLFGLTSCVPIELFDVISHEYIEIAQKNSSSKSPISLLLDNFSLFFSIASYFALMFGSILNIFFGRKFNLYVNSSAVYN
ncbi:hypothetical protein HZS_4112 [Henneguya salminicola]|nr:hypothetical protein HZS_4112 [Henneguya salminicola]